MLSYDPDTDAYLILGVDPGATQKEVEAAFRKAALTWHPDKSPAPDAAERFLDVQQAGKLLRDKRTRHAYDRLRSVHLGRRARPRPKKRPPEPFVPMRPPPAWLADKVKVHYDAVLFSLETPRKRPFMSHLASACAFVTLGGAIFTGAPLLGALALVMWAFGRVLITPPHRGLLAWAKIIPGRQRAEYHSLDQRRHRYDRLEVPFHRLSVVIVGTVSEFRVEIRGFPRTATPVLYRTANLEMAQRCAREAGQWLQLPYQRAA
ncbi:MAG: J domain-containing protein [Planctomycetota bacterium]|jgi:hypothetical protein